VPSQGSLFAANFDVPQVDKNTTADKLLADESYCVLTHSFYIEWPAQLNS
jgi:hypothetical protein